MHYANSLLANLGYIKILQLCRALFCAEIHRDTICATEMSGPEIVKFKTISYVKRKHLSRIMNVNFFKNVEECYVILC